MTTSFIASTEKPVILRHSARITHNHFSKKIIVRVCKRENVEPNFFDLVEKFGFELKLVSTMPELFKNLNDSKYSIDAILIDLSNMYAIAGVNAFEIINTIHTLINAQSGSIKDIPLGVIIDKDSEPEMIRGVLGPGIKILYPKNDWTQTGDSEQALHELLEGHSFIPKKITELAKRPTKQSQTKKTNSSNKIQLTVRQEQILNLIRDRGASNKVIAKMLKISESTVKLHITAILKKYGVRNRTQLALFSSKDKEL